ncbi:MAG: SDR family oxidoreductase [Rhodococcus sp. (in: high G+C Gram-positive bacteria)]|nr:MAG: SDR family oxidoreductase [Rhodococcus sp. (in: high G+C Gram-positive bacteria)]
MTNLSFDYTGRTVVVTGAGQGIGKEIGALFAGAGADVFLVDLDKEALDQAVSDIAARSVVADVSDTDAVQQIIDAAVSATGRLDVVVNNAGILRDSMLWKLTDDDFERVLAVHAGGTFRMPRAAVPQFRAQNYGRVINVTSYTGLHGNIGQSNYATAKAGIIGFTKTAAKELADFGVTVNAISPNADTRMIAGIPEAKRAEITRQIPAGRFAPPREMAAAVGFLASEEAAYITGTVLPVDGGISM